MKKIVSGLLLCSMLHSSVCFAEGPTTPQKQLLEVKPESNPEDASGPPVLSPLQKGQVSPFSGILFSPRAAAQIAAEISSFPDKLKIEIDTAVKNAEAKKDFTIKEQKSQCKSEKTQLEARIEANEKRITNLSKDLADAEAKVADAPNRFVWFGIGAGVGVAVTIATAFAVVEATK